MERLRSDLRSAFRQARKSPGFAALAVAILALGIGANTALFSVVNAVLFRPLPVAEPERLVEVYTDDSSGLPITSSYPDYLEFQKQTDVFSGVLAYNPTVLSRTQDGQTGVVYGELVSANYFEVLGVQASRGRVLREAEDGATGAPVVAVVSHRFWQGRLGADPDVVGKPLQLNGQHVPIAGVAPAGFNGVVVGLAADVWLSIVPAQQLSPPGENRTVERKNRSLFVKARLAPEVTVEQARAAMDVLGRRLQEAYPESNKDRGLTVVPSGDVRLHPKLDTALVPLALLLMAVPGLVLLIACSNVANLLLARASGRIKEMAIRRALGASRWRLVRQMLTESVFLSVAGGAAGLGLAWWGVHALLAWQPPLPIPIALNVPLDNTVLGFATLVALLTGCVFGLAPALHSSRGDLTPALKKEGWSLTKRHRRLGLRNLLVVAQVTASLVLLAGAALFLSSLRMAQNIDIGFEDEHALILNPGLVFSRSTPEQTQAVFAQLVERVRSLPGVESVALTTRVPLGAEIRMERLQPEGDATPFEKATEYHVTTVDPGYFQTLGIPLLQGRNFATTDSAETPAVVIVSETAARQFWGTTDPLGQRLRIDKDRVAEVIGVARDTKVATLAEDPRPYVYLAYAQNPESYLSLIARTEGPPERLLEPVRRELQQVAPDAPILSLQTMRQHLALMLYPPKVAALLLTAFGGLALLLASMGLYAVVAFSVTQRTHEIGIRQALGAERRDILRLVMREGMGLVGTGLVLGVLLGVLATQPLAPLLYGVTPADPAIFAIVSAVLTAIALIASYVPALRATRITPSEALRYE